LYGYDDLATGTFPSNVDATGFDFISGLGTLTIDFAPGTGGSFFLGAFFDHEIDESINTYFNEFGESSGSPAAGQSWEIGDPALIGGIYDHLADGTLSNTNDLSAPDDVSMALGWDFTLAAGDRAIIEMVLALVSPTSGFSLAHRDPDSGPDSQATIYFSSTLDIQPGQPGAPVPEPGTMLLVGTGIVGLASWRRRVRHGRST
jgi:hypothetical protein